MTLGIIAGVVGTWAVVVLSPMLGIIAAVLLFYAIPAALRGASPGQALRESITYGLMRAGVPAR